MKPAVANKTNCALFWYAFYNLQPGNGSGCIFLQPVSLRGQLLVMVFCGLLCCRV